MNEQTSRSGTADPASAYHGWLAGIVGVGVLITAMDSPDGSFSRYRSAVSFGVFALVSAVGHLCIIAAQRRSRLVDAPPVRRWVRTGTVICLAVAFALVPVCLLPILLADTHGWPRAKDSDLEVVSPGDTVKLTLEGSTPPISEYQVVRGWTVAVTGADEPVKPQVTLLTDHVGAYRGRRPWYQVQVQIPNEPRWAGKTVHLRVELTHEDGDKQGYQGQMSDTALGEFPVAPVGAGAQYRESWRVAFFGGAIPAVLVGFVLGGLAGTPRPKRPAPIVAAEVAPAPTT